MTWRGKGEYLEWNQAVVCSCSGFFLSLKHTYSPEATLPAVCFPNGLVKVLSESQKEKRVVFVEEVEKSSGAFYGEITNT